MKTPYKKLANSRMSFLYMMMDGNRNNDLHWSITDMEAMLLHLLDAPLRTQMAEVDITKTFGRNVSLRGLGDDLTMRAALQDDAVPANVLVTIKDYAKQNMDGSRGDLPHDVAKVVYVAVVSRSRSLRKLKVSSLPDNSFEAIARWCLAQNWVPPALRSVVRQGLEMHQEGMSLCPGAKS